MATAELSRYLAIAESIWKDYQATGPGSLESGRYEQLVAAQPEIESLPDLAGGAVRQIDKLADRCCNRSDGLCFITGEAGLVPRKDLHDEFESALEVLRSALPPTS